MKKLSTYIALALVVVLCLTGCTNPQAAPTTTANSTSTEPQGTTQPTTQPQTTTQPPATTQPQEIPYSYTLGGRMEDFTVTTWDGKTITLSEVLQEKEMVLINIWATWCGPCRNEFPYMQMAYELYSDKVEVIALSCEPEDTTDVLADFVETMGLTFPVGQDTPDFLSKFKIQGIPTSIVVDRFGVICFIESGSITDLDSFMRLFDTFLGEDYTESVLLEEIPKPRPNTEPSSTEMLNSALNAEGGSLVFTNSNDADIWPMTVCEKDGRIVVAASNTGADETVAAVNTTVTAKAGDAIVVTFKTSTEVGCDVLQICVNGTAVKSFGGEKDWMTYAWTVPADGEYQLTLSYFKDMMAGDGDDCVWVDSVAVVSGDDAANALAANPAYPVADELSLTIIDASARQIVFDDPQNVMAYFLGTTSFYLAPVETATFLVTLPAEIDPELICTYCTFDGTQSAVVGGATADGYVITGGIDTLTGTGYGYTMMYLLDSTAADPIASVTYFADEAGIQALIDEVNAAIDYYGLKFDHLSGNWSYAD